MVRLPAAPLSDPEAEAGLARLIGCYTARMESTVGSWVANILDADLSGAPRQTGDGTLRTPGAVDFFRILNEQVLLLFLERR